MAKDEETTPESVVDAPVQPEPETAPEPPESPGRALPRFRAPEAVDVKTVDGWRRAQYRAYFDQYDIHTALLPDGTTWQGGPDEIRPVEGG